MMCIIRLYKSLRSLSCVCGFISPRPVGCFGHPSYRYQKLDYTLGRHRFLLLLLRLVGRFFCFIQEEPMLKRGSFAVISAQVEFLLFISNKTMRMKYFVLFQFSKATISSRYNT